MRNKQMEIYRDYIIMLLKGHTHCVLCHSRAGYGKTHTTIFLLKQFKVEYTYSSGVATAVALFKTLYENRNGVLILDDIETIFQDEKIINLLKSALWEVDGKRLISYKTTSRVLRDYPDTFEYKGKIIILANEIRGRNDESYKALLSRCLKFELTYTLEELKNLAKDIVNIKTNLSQMQKDKIISIIDNRINIQHNFNLRLLQRLIQFVLYDIVKAENLFLNSLDVDDDTEILIEIINKYKSVKDQFEVFKETTGMSRMTFFRKKKRLQIEGVI